MKRLVYSESGNNGFNYILGFLFLLCTILGTRYQYFLLRQKEWGDESETIVAAKMMAAGKYLYSEIFNHHGPLTFLSGVAMESMGDFGVRGHRVPIALLQLISLCAIYYSPILKNNTTRIFSVVYAFSFIIFLIPLFLGHMYTYQAIVGPLILTILFLYTFPSIIDRNLLTMNRVFVGSLLLSCLPFLAVTYIPIAIILFFSSLVRPYILTSVGGIISGTVLNLLFLNFYGSAKGYLAFHFYLNSEILPIYIGTPSILSIILSAWEKLTSYPLTILSLAITSAGIFSLSRHENKIPWRSGLLVAGVGSLLVRGADFHGLAYYYLFVAISILPMLGNVQGYTLSLKYVTLVICLFFIAKSSLLLPGARQEFKENRLPTETEFSLLVKKYTNKDDKIIAYSFQNFQYIASERLPASGHFFYLPWQEKYNENPIFGIKIDACKEISEYLPKVMLIDQWKVWSLYPWEAYGGCIQNILDNFYNKTPDRPYYIRKDIPAEEVLPRGSR
ncbi:MULTISPECIES: hypothetical protein [unclassified Acidovorax]|uniref:hypothetical protein n=1 Tax=unclassified Acidovorax TaxID=2684926 RepID=UPI001C491A27|nr:MULTISPECIES: hypothetical protein [unclassified Acidovorax]MBV7429779.1 hypothetical protein [Acidovorax sp. sif0732]MBV7448857.1 hypothetical protein [Acidovorax sp. sif0715]